MMMAGCGRPCDADNWPACVRYLGGTDVWMSVQGRKPMTEDGRIRKFVVARKSNLADHESKVLSRPAQLQDKLFLPNRLWL